MRMDYSVVAKYDIRGMCIGCMERFDGCVSQFVRGILDKEEDAYSFAEHYLKGLVRGVSFHSPSREIAYERIRLLKSSVGVPNHIEHSGFSWRKTKKGGLRRRLKKT